MGEPTFSLVLLSPVRWLLTWLEQEDMLASGVRPVDPSTMESSPGQNMDDGVMVTPEVGVLMVTPVAAVMESMRAWSRLINGSELGRELATVDIETVDELVGEEASADIDIGARLLAPPVAVMEGRDEGVEATAAVEAVLLRFSGTVLAYVDDTDDEKEVADEDCCCCC